MAVKSIVTWPSPILRVEAHDMDPTSGETARICQDLVDTMYSKSGAGLSAPQIGEAARIFVLDPRVMGLGGDELPLIFINPEITWVSEEVEVDKEGCLSFPDIWLNVKRPVGCKLKAFDFSNEEFEVEGNGLYARALQHETDHLNGKLMLDFVSKMKQEAVKKKMKRRKQ